ncbi:MAG: cytochrome c biogenesis protein CcsA [Eubacteriales bacterium]
MNQFYEIGLHWVAVVFYAISACFFIYGFVFKKERALKWGVIAAVAGMIPHTLALTLRWYYTGHGPYMRRYEVYSSDVWVGLVVFAVAQWRKPVLRLLGVIIMPASFLLIGMAVLSSPEIRPLPETFQTFWLFIHIFFAKVAYGSCLVGAALAVIYLNVSRQTSGSAGLVKRLPEPDIIDELSYKFNGFGFVMIGVMTAAGAIWANDAWGSYWAWDPVETWSLISWVIYGIYLHLRRIHGWKGAKAAWFNIGAFILLLLTIFGIGLFYLSNHSPYMN